MSEGGLKAFFVRPTRIVFGLEPGPVRPPVVLQMLDHFFSGRLLPRAALGAVGFQGIGQRSCKNKLTNLNKKGQVQFLQKG